MIDLKRVWNSNQLPTLPTVAIKLTQMANDPDVSIKQITDLIKTDPALSLKLIKAANSTYFGLACKVSSIERAIPLLGITVVTSLSLSFSLAESAMTPGPLVAYYKKYWQRSLVDAAACDILVSYLPTGLECEHFLAGLLSEIGQLVLLKTIPNDYLNVLKEEAGQRSLIEAEKELLGVDRIEVGSKFLEKWNVPESFVSAVLNQSKGVDDFSDLLRRGDWLSFSTAVACAVGEYYLGPRQGYAFKRIQDLLGKYLNLTPEDIEKYLLKVHDRVLQAGELFNTNLSELGDPADLMSLASEQLAQIAVREHVSGVQAMAQSTLADNRIKELETQHEQLQKQALHDPLTKIYNRRFLEETLTREIRRCCRDATAVGVVFLDIDKFKSLNDTYGHQFGDHVLQRVAAVTQEVLRQADTLARFGGEEFVVLVNEPTEKGIERVAERIRSRIESEEIFYQNKRVTVTASLGASMTIPRRVDPDCMKRLIETADKAMYESKQNGRNRVTIQSLLTPRERQLSQSIVARKFSRWLVNRGTIDIPTISKAISEYRSDRIRIGDLAKRCGLLDDKQIETILNAQQQTGERFGELAVTMGMLDDNQLINLLMLQQEHPIRFASSLSEMGLIPSGNCKQLVLQYCSETPGMVQVASNFTKVTSAV